MNAILLDGKKISEKIEKELKEKVLKIKKPLTLAIVLVGENQASKKYIEQKKKFGKEIYYMKDEKFYYIVLVAKHH